MILIIGLGNPGEKFEHTRHNTGFMALDFFAKHHGFANFEMVKKHNALISEKDNMILVKPQTFMNESGKSVASVIKNTKKHELIVVHDDIDLPLGSIKIVENRGAAGHKGIESIIKHIGNDHLVRLRIGIQPEKGKPKNPEGFVIKKFTKEEREILNPIIAKTADALDFFIKNGLERAMNEYNR